MYDQNGLHNYLSGNQNFFDDSILFSIKSNFDGNDLPDLSSPFTPMQGTYRDNNNNNFTNMLNSHHHHGSVSNSSNSNNGGCIGTAAWSLDEKPSREQLMNTIKYTNHTLKSFGFSCLGDLMCHKDEEIQKTLNTLYELIQQRIKDIEFRKETFEKIAKLESDKSMLMKNIDRLKQENSSLSKEIGQLNNSCHQHEKKCKIEKEKLINEKEELLKQLTKANQKHIQFQHEIRKKEIEVNRVKEQMRKPLFEKNGLSKHSAEIINSTNQGIITSGFAYKPNAENEFINTFNNSIDVYRNKLITENNELRNIISYFQHELNQILKEKKDEFIMKRLSEMNNASNAKQIKAYYESCFSETDFVVIKSGIYQMPIEKIGTDLMQIFKENFKIFRKFWSNIISIAYPLEFFKDITKDLMDIDPNFAKIKNFDDLKKALIALKKKISEANNVKYPIKQTNTDRGLFLYNSKSGEDQGNNGNMQNYPSNSDKNVHTAPDFYPKSKPESDILKSNEHKNSQDNLGIIQLLNDGILPIDLHSPSMKKYSITPSKIESLKRNENMAPAYSESKNLEEKFNELLNFKFDEKSNEIRHQTHERRKTAGEINRWKMALNSRNANQ